MLEQPAADQRGVERRQTSPRRLVVRLAPQSIEQAERGIVHAAHSAQCSFLRRPRIFIQPSDRGVTSQSWRRGQALAASELTLTPQTSAELDEVDNAAGFFNPRSFASSPRQEVHDPPDPFPLQTEIEALEMARMWSGP